MILKSIRLENIRSYRSQEIKFSKGSLLLAGDIGTGKSTILLGIEFALFGLKTGELSGGMLLRHGAKEGAVELFFEADGKEVIVKRTLKKSRDRIGQGPGYVIINGVKEELMPKEIRAKVFEILNYPKSLVSKNQDLIYRFTVYTPQEDMKKIIYENSELRLDTLRKVFNIDKYKRIRENAQIYVRKLKERRNNLEGRISDLDEKKKQKKILRDEIAKLEEKEKQAKDILKEAKGKTSTSKERLAQTEKKVKELNEKRKEFEMLNLELANILRKRKQDKKETDEEKPRIEKLKEELKDYKEEDNKEKYREIENKICETEKDIRKIVDSKSEIKAQVNNLEQEKNKVEKIDNCPLCRQEVPHEHKESIRKQSEEKKEKLKKEFLGLEDKRKEKEEILDKLKKEHKKIAEKISLNRAFKVKKENLAEKEKRVNQLLKGIEESKKKIGEINSKKLELNNAIKESMDIEKQYDEEKKEYEEKLKHERKKELEYNSINKEKEGSLKQLNILQKEIEEKEKFKKHLINLTELINWIESRFMRLVGNMEKHVMMSVYHEFNELLAEWFNMLIEDDGLNIRLDDTFSVVCEQNGYETTIDNLSGGEKTAVALAYRLSLNRVINDIVSEIRTKDILILDEPTEGFSTAQLDRVRDVLNELKIKQIIMVSHENKIESFVDNVVRINKNEGHSEVY